MYVALFALWILSRVEESVKKMETDVEKGLYAAKVSVLVEWGRHGMHMESINPSLQ